jgi:S-DNA-T family DNA segregation ATPase FtsK/SpoIIIE
MAKRKPSTEKVAEKSEIKRSFFAFLKTKQTQTIFGFFLMLFSLFLCIAFISFFFNWQEDQSTIHQLSNRAVKSENLLGKIGANLGNFFIYKGFGIAAFIVSFQLFSTGFSILLKRKLSKIIISWNWGLAAMLLVSISLGFLHEKFAIISGVIGFEINQYSQDFLGKTGLIILIIFFFIAYIVARYKVNFDGFINRLKLQKEDKEQSYTSTSEGATAFFEEDEEELFDNSLNSEANNKSEFEKSVIDLKPTISKHSDVKTAKEEVSFTIERNLEPNLKTEATQEKELEPIVEIDVAINREEKSVAENLSDKLVKDFGEFDPTLELANFKFPTFNLLKQYNETISIDPEELEANKDKIVETLKN